MSFSRSASTTSIPCSSYSTSSRESIPSSVALHYEIPDLTMADEFSDITLNIDGCRLYTCRGILASASPVFRHMLTAISKVKQNDRELKLPGKSFDHLHELLQCISPAIQKPITGANVYLILPLADEYQMGKLKGDCELWLLDQLKSGSFFMATEEKDKSKEVTVMMQYLEIAQTYSLLHLRDQAVQLISGLEVDELEARPEYQKLDSDVVIQILKCRVQSFEKSAGKSKRTIDFWRKQSEELEELVKLMGREKMTVKRILDELEIAWDVKSPDTRCIDPAHIYCPRNFECNKCTHQLQTFMKMKLNFLLNKGTNCSGIKWPH